MIRLMAAVLLLAGQDPKAPVPDAAAQKEAEKTIREVFKDQYGRPTLADRQALARELLQQAQSPDNPPAVRYVLLRDAQSLGDLETGAKAVELMSKHFDVNLLALRLKTLNLSIPKTPEEFKPLAEQYLALSEDALQAGDAEVADKAAQAAMANARKAKDVPLLTRTQARAKEMGELRARADAVRKAEETLQRDANNPGANGLVGRYECLVRGDWEKGLPLLAKSDSPLKAAAALDLAAPTEPAKQIEAGDAWWTASEGETGTAKQNLRGRALHWYGKALSKATGLTKLKLENRFQEMGRKAAAEAPSGKGPFDLAPRGYIRNWLILGPFSNQGDKALETDFLNGEDTYEPRDGREVEVAGGAKLKWEAYASQTDNIAFPRVPHLGVTNGQPWVAVYAACWLTVDADQEVQVRLGSDDGYHLWIGNRPVVRETCARGMLSDQKT
jgi:hypothetical protein